MYKSLHHLRLGTSDCHLLLDHFSSTLHSGSHYSLQHAVIRQRPYHPPDEKLGLRWHKNRGKSMYSHGCSNMIWQESQNIHTSKHVTKHIHNRTCNKFENRAYPKIVIPCRLKPHLIWNNYSQLHSHGNVSELEQKLVLLLLIWLSPRQVSTKQTI